MRTKNTQADATGPHSCPQFQVVRDVVERYVASLESPSIPKSLEHLHKASGNLWTDDESKDQDAEARQEKQIPSSNVEPVAVRVFESVVSKNKNERPPCIPPSQHGLNTAEHLTCAQRHPSLPRHTCGSIRTRLLLVSKPSHRKFIWSILPRCFLEMRRFQWVL